MYSKLLDNGKIDDTETKSEYERGFIDCWNKYVDCHPNHVRGWKENFPEYFW